MHKPRWKKGSDQQGRQSSSTTPHKVLEINQGHVHLLSIKKAFLVAGSPAAQLCAQEVVAKSGLETGTDLSKASGVSGAILSSSFSSVVSLTE